MDSAAVRPMMRARLQKFSDFEGERAVSILESVHVD
jgi:hypothetical protein